MWRRAGAALALALSACASQPTAPLDDGLETSALVADGAQLCELVREKYAFFDGKAAAWEKACTEVPEKAMAASNSGERLRVLEDLIDVLYDPHASFGRNSGVSPRLVPSGNDYWIENGTVTAVRSGSAAAIAGLVVGDVVIAIDETPLEAAIAERILPDGVTPTDAQRTWAANAAAAGYRGRLHSVTVMRDGGPMTLSLEASLPKTEYTPVRAELLPGGIGYIAFNNSLGESDTVAAFDAALESLRGAHAWIIDLRDTPGGGSTDVAEPVMGRFIASEGAYQKIKPLDAPAWMKTVSPRGPWTAQGPVAVLAGRWTGSMGEGMAIGFDGLRRGEVFGSDMAGLAGGVESFTLTGSGLSVRFPTYDLAHVDGTPRYKWHPTHPVMADNGAGLDLALDAAVAWINSHEF